jgi:ATP dependent DNA ligase C terminal region
MKSSPRAQVSQIPDDEPTKRDTRIEADSADRPSSVWKQYLYTAVANLNFSECFTWRQHIIVVRTLSRRSKGFARSLSDAGKRAGSPYRSGERCGDWLKWRANRGQEFVIAGYIPNGAVVDSLLVGYYEGRYLMYAGSVRAGLPIEFRRVLVPHLDQLQIAGCPFVNLPDRTEGRWGEGLTAAKMVACYWLHPFLVARIECLEWTPQERLRHLSFRWNPYRQRGSRGRPAEFVEQHPRRFVTRQPQLALQKQR